MFAVDDIDETLGRLRKRGAQLVGDVVRYQDSYRLSLWLLRSNQQVKTLARIHKEDRPGALAEPELLDLAISVASALPALTLLCRCTILFYREGLTPRPNLVKARTAQSPLISLISPK